jgi:hypothetical protein
MLGGLFNLFPNPLCGLLMFIKSSFQFVQVTTDEAFLGTTAPAPIQQQFPYANLSPHHPPKPEVTAPVSQDQQDAVYQLQWQQRIPHGVSATPKRFDPSLAPVSRTQGSHENRNDITTMHASQHTLRVACSGACDAFFNFSKSSTISRLRSSSVFASAPALPPPTAPVLTRELEDPRDAAAGGRVFALGGLEIDMARFRQRTGPRWDLL